MFFYRPRLLFQPCVHCMVSKQARHLAALAAKRRSKRTEGTSSQPVQADSDPECDDVEARDSRVIKRYKIGTATGTQMVKISA